MGRNIKIIATGGTIASKDMGNGLRPGLGAEAVINTAFSGDCSGAQEIREMISKGELCLDLSGLFSIDSSDMRPELWNELGVEIDRLVRGTVAGDSAGCVDVNADENVTDGRDDPTGRKYDGIIVLHGTDTMAYTAGALSAMFKGLPIPVVLTGSQLPIEVEGSDGTKNICDAVRTVLALSESGFGEAIERCGEDDTGACETTGRFGDNNVYIVFGGRVIDGRYATKMDTDGFDAFAAVDREHECYVNDLEKIPNVFFTDIEVDAVECNGPDDSVRQANDDSVNSETHMKQVDVKDVETVRDTEYTFMPLSMAEVQLVKVHPGLSSIQLSKMISDGIDAVLLELYGAGGLPTLYDSLLPVLERAVEGGVKVFAVSQCLYHKTDLGRYEVGKKLASVGVIPLGSYSTEYALACARGANKWYKWTIN